MRSDWALLNHIRDCMELVDSFLGDTPLQQADARTRDAVLHKLQLIAQSSIRLSDELKSRQPQIGWQQLKAFRNVLVPEHFALDIKEADQALCNSLPLLKQAVLAELGNMRRPGAAELAA